MLTASVIFPLLLFGYASWANYRAAFERADDQIRQALDLSAEHALRVFRSITVTFDSVEQITRGRTERTLRANAAELSERLKQFVSALPDIGSVWILNAEGDAIVSSLFFPLPPAANAPEWAWLRSQLANDASLHIGDVLRIQPTGELIFPVSKWRTDSSGTFSGITEISVSPAAFERFYAPLAERTSASFGLIREDGAVLARYPVPTIAGIKLDTSTGFSQLVARSPQGGQYTSVSGVDGIERRFAARRLEGFPLYVTSSLATRDIVQGWLWHMASYLVFGIPATAFFVVLILLAMRRTDEFYAESERREAAEASLRQAQKMEAVGQLTGGVAHDFNNLLTIILGNLELALKHAPEGRQQRLLKNVYRAGERAAELTKRLLAFSRNQPLDPRPIDANRLVADMSDLLGRTLGETISIETVRGGGLWLTEVDKTQLESALLNLAINARDAMPARRQADDRNRQRLSRRGLLRLRRRRHTRPIRHDRDVGYRDRDVGGRDRQGVRPILHHKSGRRRHRSRPQPGPWLRQAERRPHPDLQRARRGNHGQGLPAPEFCRRPRGDQARRRRRKSRREARKRCWWSRTTRRCALSSPKPCAASTTGCWKPPTARQRFRWFADPRRSTCCSRMW